MPLNERIRFYFEKSAKSYSSTVMYSVLIEPKRQLFAGSWTDYDIEKFLSTGADSCKTIQSTVRPSGKLLQSFLAMTIVIRQICNNLKRLCRSIHNPSPQKRV